MIKPEILNILFRRGLGIGTIKFSIQSREVVVMLTKEGACSIRGKSELSNNHPCAISDALEEAFYKCIKKDTTDSLVDAKDGL